MSVIINYPHRKTFCPLGYSFTNPSQTNYAENLSVYYYPGEVFRVLWERPGTFTVRAAVNLRFSYRFPERSVYVSVIYTEEKEVEVMATSVNR